MSRKHGGFAALSPEQRREMASRGGKAAVAKGVIHRWTPETAAEAGRKGGLATSSNRKHMSEIGTLGGAASRKYRSPAP